MKVFLGGTCNDSKWRDTVIPKLSIDYYNPVKDEWSEEAFQEEIQAKLDCNYFLYCLTPRYTGYFSFAEVINESFHYSNQTIFCFLNEDGDHKFSKEETESLKELGSRVVENGGLWLENLEEVATFLNSTQEDRIQLNKYDFFISYGRKHSSSLASKLNHSFIKEGKTVWMDKFCIPTGVDFQMSINDGITKSDNFIYIISPHSVQSDYCTKELEVALKYGKRIIPLLHVMEPGLDELMHPEIQKLNWFYFDSERKFQHGFTELLKTTSTDPGYLEANTKWLQKAVEWESHERNRDFLLGETETILAEDWFNDAIEKEKSPPPSELNGEFIESSVEGLALGKKRKKRNGYLIRALSVVMTIAAVVAVYSFFQADEAKNKALSAQQQEKIERKKAEDAQKKAEEAQNEAIEEKEKAIEAEKEAKEQRKKAEEAQETAVKEKGIAQDERNKAKKEKEIADDERTKAKVAEVEAREAEKEAQENEQKANTLLLQSIAKSLFKQANDMKEDQPILAKKSALLAYDLNNEHHEGIANQNAFELARQFGAHNGIDLSTSHAIKKIQSIHESIVVHDASGKIHFTDSDHSDLVPFDSLHLHYFDMNSRDKTVLILDTDNTLVLYRMDEGDVIELNRFDYGSKRVFDICIDEENTAYLLTSDGIEKWSSESNKSEKVLNVTPTIDSRIIYHSGNIFAIINNSVINIKNESSIKMQNRLSSICFLNDQNFVVGDVDGKIYLLNIKRLTHERIGTVQHDFEISSMRYSDINKILYTCSVDESVKMWPIDPNGKELPGEVISHNGYNSWVRDIHFADEKHQWLVLGGDGKKLQFIPATYDFIYDNMQKEVISLTDEEMKNLIDIDTKGLNKLRENAE